MQAVVEEKLRLLSHEQEKLRLLHPKAWKDKLKQDKEYQRLEQQVEALKLYQQFKVNDWVTDYLYVGQIVDLNLSPGGMPQVWVNWDGLALPEQVTRLKLLGDNWLQGWKIGDRALERGIHHVTITRFVWCKNTNQVELVISENGIERKTRFDNLSPSNGLLFDLDLTSVATDPIALSPSKTRRHKGEGTGKLYMKPYSKDGKDYEQWWYQWEIKQGDHWLKRTKYVSQKLLAQIQKLELEKAPVREILKVLGVVN